MFPVERRRIACETGSADRSPAPPTSGVEGTAEDKAEIYWNDRKPAPAPTEGNLIIVPNGVLREDKALTGVTSTPAPTVTVDAPAELIAKWRNKAQILSHQNEISYLLVCANELESWWAERTTADLDRQAFADLPSKWKGMYCGHQMGHCTCQTGRNQCATALEAALQVAGPAKEEQK